ncbi:MAG: sigma-54 dependent transcriptional regulator [Deltaproteobacteria bacterium]|nr:sigma-54 dependent transcriptional regulator [Deltaproteobacteria bacterium]
MPQVAAILIVEDDEASRLGLIEFIKSLGYAAFEADSVNAALGILNSSNNIDIIITDLKLPDGTGLDLLKNIKEDKIQGREREVVVATGFSSVKSAVEAIKLGAYDYITKPINLDELDLIIKRIISNKRLIDEINILKTRLDERFNFGNLITSSKKMIDIVSTAVAVADKNSTVLIEGESGTGKELLANIIVNNSQRKNKPFIKVNCAALSESILESELFGHERGAYTGADSLYKGRFEISDGGTIFLDEIGEIPLRTQSKILRVLQEKEFERVGGNKTIKVNIRIIAASQDIEKKVKKGEFRQDLYYRLNVVNLKLIPLRERKEDIPFLIKKFLEDFSKETGKNIKGLNKNALDVLLNYDFPGNVRELKNTIEFMTATSGSEILDESMLPNYLKESYPGYKFSGRSEKSLNNAASESYMKIPSNLTLEEAENLIIQKTLERNAYNKVKTANDLNIGLKTIYRKLNNVS